MSKSSAGAEYRALSTTACELTWLTRLLDEIQNNPINAQQTTPRLYTDSTLAATIAHNLVAHQRTKHIEIGIHFIHDKVLSRDMDILHVPTKENPADLYTKPLPGPIFTYLLPKLHLLNIHIPDNQLPNT